MGAALPLAKVARAVQALVSEWMLPCMVAAAMVPVLACTLGSPASALLNSSAALRGSCVCRWARRCGIAAIVAHRLHKFARNLATTCTVQDIDFKFN